MTAQHTAHTPGPWNARGIGSDMQATHIYSSAERDAGGTGCVATVMHNLTGNADANARLIAAAPELLGALREASRLLVSLEATGDFNAMGRLTTNRVRNAIESARAALRLAEGA